MKVLIKPAPLDGVIAAPASKSHAHRALICGALSSEVCELSLPSLSQDTEATLRCLHSLGVGYTHKNGILTLRPPEKFAAEAELDCGESGSTLRFMLPVAASLGVKCRVVARGRLPQRPLHELIKQLNAHGVSFSGDTLPFTVSGIMSGGDFTFSGSGSSQYVTGVLLAAPLTGQRCTVRVTQKLQSKPYVDLTVKTMRDFGAFVSGEYTVPAGTSYRSPGRYGIEGDCSNAAFWLCAGVGVGGLDDTTAQGDYKIVDILGSSGAVLTRGDGYIRFDISRAHGFDAHAQDIPDIVMPLCAYAATVRGRTVITGAQRLRLKESDRLVTTYEMLRALGADITQTEDGFVINGKESLRGGTVDSAGDHRIAMAAAVAAMRCENEVTVCGAEAVCKSYPSFWDDYSALGGDIRVIL